MRTAVLALYKEHQTNGTLPTSARFLYYELIANGVIVKGKEGDEGDNNRMIKALTWLRKNGQVAWDDITDETRSLTDWQVYPTIRDGIHSAWKRAQISLWTKERPPMVLCESRSLAGVLENLAADYQVPIASTNGAVGGFLHTEVGPALSPGQRVLYFGDLDKSGRDIEVNTRTVLQEIVGSLNWERIAITDAQVEEYDLPIIKRPDGRDHKLHDAVETEALGQTRIIGLLQDRMKELMPDSRKKSVYTRGERERKKLGMALGFTTNATVADR